ncbi:MAG TPA: DUF1345 domain-containing protein [Jatrophihabitantaceae bacterium]|jgi:uncharacterized membrane protein|nr:DUF1345 domain-containing protein [Jatrophihabitantaceae bacterium]
MAVLGLAVAIVVGMVGNWRYAPLAGWDVAALSFAGSAWAPIGFYDATRTAAHATREEPGRTATSVIVISAALASLGAVGVIIVQANSAKGITQDLVAGFGVGSVALSWFAVHTLFTLRYARLYFTGADGGVNFNQKLPPRYLDFAYLAFTIGMTFQVSDTDLQSAPIRATALRHALLSYLFGAVILASTINLIAGLSGTGG